MTFTQEELAALYDLDQRRNVEYPDTHREVLPNLIRHIDPSPSGQSVILHSELDERTADRAIEEQIAFFEDQGQDFEWKVYDYDMPGDLGERLDARGFTVREIDAILVLVLRDAPELLKKPVLHDVERISTPTMAEKVAAVERDVWGEEVSWLRDHLTLMLEQHPDQISVFVARVDGRPASAGWILYPRNSRFASLWGGSTRPEYRGRGLYRALLATRVQEALARGVQFLTVDASPMSRPILERHGFVQIAEAFGYKYEVRSRREVG